MVKMKFDVKKVFQERLASSMGLDKYKKIINLVKTTDVSKDADFQRTFNGFYIVRRNEAWRKAYYDYFEQIKKETPTFAQIIRYLYEKTGFIEPSFSSKMLATLNPNNPIWDQYVLQNLNMELDGKTKEEKLCNAIKIYNNIENWYAEFLHTEKARECIREFDSILPDYSWMSDIKKIDFILWSIR